MAQYGVDWDGVVWCVKVARECIGVAKRGLRSIRYGDIRYGEDWEAYGTVTLGTARIGKARHAVQRETRGR